LARLIVIVTATEEAHTLTLTLTAEDIIVLLLLDLLLLSLGGGGSATSGGSASSSGGSATSGKGGGTSDDLIELLGIRDSLGVDLGVEGGHINTSGGEHSLELVGLEIEMKNREKLESGNTDLRNRR
jgi:hypothetical protein